MKGKGRNCARHEIRDKKKVNAEVTQNVMSQDGGLKNGRVERTWAESWVGALQGSKGRAGE